MSEWEARARLASDSLTENEALTADLDDSAAKALLDWGRACAQTIARDTKQMSAETADAAMEPRMRATNKWLRAVVRFVAHRDDMEPAVRIALMAHIVEQSGIAYAGLSPAMNTRERADLLYRFREVDDPVQVIAILRAALEPSRDILVAPHGAVHDQEEVDVPQFGSSGGEDEPRDVDDVADYTPSSDAPEEEI